MQESRAEPALQQSLEQYRKRLQERASQSIHQLKYALEERELAKDEGEAGLEQSSVDKGSDDADSDDDSANAACLELQHSHAVNQLKILLQHEERIESEICPSRRKVPFHTSTQNTWPVGDNDCSTHQPVTPSPAHDKDQAFVTAAVEETGKWPEELKLLYQERVNVLDDQIQSRRKELSESRKTCKDLEGRLKHHKLLISARNSSWVGCLCLKCAQHEPVLSQTHSNLHMLTIERITKERDDLMDALVSLRQNMKEMQQRESNACEQVKKAVQMAEEASLEKTKALVQCEQLKSEMERQKNRLERELAAQLNKRADEKEALREEMKKEREDLAAVV